MRPAFLHFAVLIISSAQALAQQQGVAGRGDHVMGFSHDKTTHHFLLYANGGEINVASNEAGDRYSGDYRQPQK